MHELSTLRASGETTQANELEAIAGQPQATWLNGGASGSTAAVAAITSAAAAAGQVPVLVVYDMPHSHCGGTPSGGAASASAYASYVAGVAAGLAQRSAIVVVEPDALSELLCAPAAAQASGFAMLRTAVVALTGDHNAAVYLDAGHPGWWSPAAEAAGLQQILTGTNAGFAVNVSGFAPLASDIADGTSISQLAGGRHFVVDTSRSGGDVPAGESCNPPQARLGPAPTTATGNPLVDAELWIKAPGESDGTCNGGPPAGQFWLTYALSLAGF